MSFQAAEFTWKAKETQTAILLHVAGPEAQEIYQTLVFPQPGEGEDDPRQDVNAILRKFQDYCNPRRNTVYERHRF